MKVLAGALSATFNIDGHHLDRFVDRKSSVMQTLCDQLLLHDKILIPTQDYLTAAGLVRILGERNVVTLLESQKLQFVRLRGTFGYVRGDGRDGRLITVNEASGTLPASAPLARAIEAGVSEIRDEVQDKKKLVNLLHDQSVAIEMSEVVDATHKDTYADLSETSLWKPQYRLPNPEILALPTVKKMQVRGLGPNTDAANNVVDACLALGLMNIELYLANKLDCVSTATGSPIGDSISLKRSRLGIHREQALWNFLDFVGIPDVSEPLLADKDEMRKFIKLTSSNNAEAFRRWFHQNESLNERELVKAYIDLLREVPWIQRGPARGLRMAASLGLSMFGFGFAIDAAATAIDNFVVDKYVRGRSAKIFVEDFRTFSGRIKTTS
jgi:hypothetical protein